MTNICGVLLKAQPDFLEMIAGVIEVTDGTELHASTDDGQMVVTVEDTAEMAAHDRIMALHQLPGVMSFTLSYHHFEPDGADLATAVHPTAIPA